MGRRNLPINVPDVEDVTIEASDLGVGAHEFDFNRSPAEIGTHGEVCDRGDKCDGRGDVVEDTVSARLRETQANEGEGSNGHDGSDGLSNESAVERMQQLSLSRPTKYQSEPCVVMAMSAVPPLLVFGLTSRALLTMFTERSLSAVYVCSAARSGRKERSTIKKSILEECRGCVYV